MRLLTLLFLAGGLACGSAAGKIAKDGGTADDGAVLECTTVDDCGTGEICVTNTCIPAGCDDNEISGNESDVDCGGDCLPCTEGALCNAARDCSSRYCDGFNHCRDCEMHDECAGAGDAYCVLGSCVDQLTDGVACSEEIQCESGVCENEGVCCDIVCDGDCSDGSCTPLVGNGVTCSMGDQCLSTICDAEDDVCCNESCTADCSTGTCIKYGNGTGCTVNSQCVSGDCETRCEGGTSCATEEVCCDSNCSAVGGVCAGGTCMSAVTNYTGSCTVNAANPITYQTGLTQCVSGLANSSAALGIAGVGNVTCAFLAADHAWTPMDENADWSYSGGRWHGDLGFVDGFPSGIDFTSCYKYSGESNDEALRVYVDVVP